MGSEMCIRDRLIVTHCSRITTSITTDPHAGPRGRRIRKACGHMRRPRGKCVRSLARVELPSVTSTSISTFSHELLFEAVPKRFAKHSAQSCIEFSSFSHASSSPQSPETALRDLRELPSELQNAPRKLPKTSRRSLRAPLGALRRAEGCLLYTSDAADE